MLALLVPSSGITVLLFVCDLAEYRARLTEAQYHPSLLLNQLRLNGQQVFSLNVDRVVKELCVEVPILAERQGY